jgi:hypothetical protein
MRSRGSILAFVGLAATSAVGLCASQTLLTSCASDDSHAVSRGSASGSLDAGLAAVTPAPAQQVLYYFEGNVDVAHQAITMTYRLPSGELVPESQLPYGDDAGEVYFHTCSGTVSWTPSSTDGGLGGIFASTIQSVNLNSTTVLQLTAVIDSVSDPENITYASPLASYPIVAPNSASNCGTPSAAWTFHDANGENFTFKGEADGIVGTTCTRTVTSSLGPEANPYGMAIPFTYSMVGGGGGAGCGGTVAARGGGGGGSSAVFNGSAGTTLVAYAAGGAGGFATDAGGPTSAGGRGQTATGAFTLASSDELAALVGGGGGAGYGGGGSGYFGGGGGGRDGGGGGGSSVGGAGGGGVPTGAGDAGGSEFGGRAEPGTTATGGVAGIGGLGTTINAGGGGYGGGGGSANASQTGGQPQGKGGSNGNNGDAGVSNSVDGGAGALNWASSTTLPAGVGAGGALLPGTSLEMGGNAGLVILVYTSPTTSCSF